MSATIDTAESLETLLVAANEMACEAFGRDDAAAVRRMRHWLQFGYIKAGKLGSQWAITRRRLREQLQAAGAA